MGFTFTSFLNIDHYFYNVNIQWHSLTATGIPRQKTRCRINLSLTHKDASNAWLGYGQGASIIKCLMTLRLSIIPVRQPFQKIIREIWQASENGTCKLDPFKAMHSDLWVCIRLWITGWRTHVQFHSQTRFYLICRWFLTSTQFPPRNKSTEYF